MLIRTCDVEFSEHTNAHAFIVHYMNGSMLKTQLAERERDTHAETVVHTRLFTFWTRQHQNSRVVAAHKGRRVGAQPNIWNNKNRSGLRPIKPRLQEATFVERH